MRLTSIITAAILAASSAGAIAAEGGIDRNTSDYCNAIKDLANEAMAYRQEGVSEQRFRAYLREERDLRTREYPMVNTVVITAYEKPVYANPEDRRHVIEKFMQDWRKACTVIENQEDQ